jgi:hypothetical protein
MIIYLYSAEFQSVIRVTEVILRRLRICHIMRNFEYRTEHSGFIGVRSVEKKVHLCGNTRLSNFNEYSQDELTGFSRSCGKGRREFKLM